jgi:transposase
MGGAPGSRLANKLAMPVSGATLLRMIRAIAIEELSTPRVLGVDEWAWRKGQTYGTILCDLELGRVVDLLPDRNAASFAAWLRQHPGVDIIVRDRSGLYADGARQGAPAARQIADRWHLLRNLGDALRSAVDRHRAAVRSAARQVAGHLAEHYSDQQTKPISEQTRLTAKRTARQDLYKEMCRLHAGGMTIGAIARALGVSRQKVERWLKSGGPATHDKPAQPKLLDTWSGILEQRWLEGCRNGTRLWRDLRDQGVPISVTTVKRWATARRLRGAGTPEVIAATTAGQWKAPSSRRCARLLTTAPEKLDADERRFIEHLGQTAPGLIQAAVVANAFTRMVRDHHDTGFDAWLEAARAGELRSFADGIDRDAAAVRAALTEPWSTSPVEGHINRVKTIKRQMYGRANYDLLRQRVLAAA